MRKQIEQRSDEIRSEVLQSNLHHGESEHPLSRLEFKTILQSVVYSYGPAKQLVQDLLNPKSSAKLDKLGEESYVAKKNELKVELGHVQNRLANDEDVQKARPNPVSFGKRFVAAIPILILAGEVFLDASAFSSLRTWFVIGLLISLAFNASKYVIISFLTNSIKEMRSWKLKLIAVLGTLTAMTVVFYGLASLRTGALASAGISDAGGSLVFMGLSLFLFCSVWLAHAMTSSIREEISEYDGKKRSYVERQELLSKEGQLKTELKELEIERETTKSSRVVDLDQADSLFRLIDQHYKLTAMKLQSNYMRGRRIMGEEIPNWIESMIIPDVICPEDLAAIQNIITNDKTKKK